MDFGGVLLVIRGNLGYVKSLAMSSSGNTIVVANMQARVRVLARTGTPKFSLEGHSDVVSVVGISEDGSRSAWPRIVAWRCDF